MNNTHNLHRKPLVLMVDDVPKNLQVLGTILKEEDVEIAAAMNGRQALNIVAKVKPDLILLDVMMPELNGYETLEILRSNPETADIPVIFLTARTEMDDIVKGLKLGAVDYVTKPFNQIELLTRVRNHLELKISRDALKEANAAKDKFFSIISHDLRTPFAIIIGFAEYLTEQYGRIPEDKVMEIFQDILSISKRSHQLFENLLQWSRSQAGRIEYHPEEIDFQTLVKENLCMIKERAKEKGIGLNMNIPDQFRVHADKNMLNTVIRNLTSNAVKFTSPGGMIKIYAERDDQHCRICVEDTGIGIPADAQKKLFHIDEHISTNGTEQEEGAGLGLILVKEFVERNGGAIWVESEEGKGSRFNFTLPLN